MFTVILNKGKKGVKEWKFNTRSEALLKASVLGTLHGVGGKEVKSDTCIYIDASSWYTH